MSLSLRFSEKILTVHPDWRKPPHPVQTTDYRHTFSRYLGSLTPPRRCVHLASIGWPWQGYAFGKKPENGSQHSCRCHQVRSCIFNLRTTRSWASFDTRCLHMRSRKLGLEFRLIWTWSSTNPTSTPPPIIASAHPRDIAERSWDDRGVWVSIGTRLGVGGINPAYHEATNLSLL